MPVSSGERLRDDGCAAVLAASKTSWRHGYEIHAAEFIDSMFSGEVFTGEHLRLLIEPLIGSPHHPNACGAMARSVLNRWMKMGIIRQDGLNKATDPLSHAHVYRVYVMI